MSRTKFLAYFVGLTFCFQTACIGIIDGGMKQVDCRWLDKESFSVPPLKSELFRNFNIQDYVVFSGHLVEADEYGTLKIEEISDVRNSLLEQGDLDQIKGSMMRLRFRDCARKGSYLCKLVLTFGNAGFEKYPKCTTFWRGFKIKVMNKKGQLVAVSEYLVVDYSTVRVVSNE